MNKFNRVRRARIYKHGELIGFFHSVLRVGQGFVEAEFNWFCDFVEQRCGGYFIILLYISGGLIYFVGIFNIFFRSWNIGMFYFYLSFRKYIDLLSNYHENSDSVEDFLLKVLTKNKGGRHNDNFKKKLL